MEKKDCQFEGIGVRISDSAFIHMRVFEIDAYTLCDMLSDIIECPKKKKTGKAFRKTSRRVCSRRGRKTYNIILDEYFCNKERLWSVSHLEPI
jgi:hypothetical protein